MRFHSRLAAEHMPEGILGAEGGKFIYRLILDSWSNGDFRVIFAKKTSVSVFDGDCRRIFHAPTVPKSMPPYQFTMIDIVMPAIHDVLAASRLQIGSVQR